MHESTIIQRALLTVYDKTHIVALAEHLHLHGVEILSTGNTAALLKQHNIPVTLVGDYTGFPEMMDGRVKTLHPKIHGGILGRRDIDNDVMITHNIPDIDLVVVNLYPFQAVTQKPDCTLEDAIENIDIGGPTLLRGAAKNHAWCTVVVDPNDYQYVIQELTQNHGAVSESLRFRLATKAFAHTAQYDGAIANYLGQKIADEPQDGFGSTLSLHYARKDKLRYGENPHQSGAFYVNAHAPLDSVAGAIVHQGKTLSYNNIADADTALECVKSFDKPSCVIVKHANPCGVASANTLHEAYQHAYACDPTSAFGGILAFNQAIDLPFIELLFNQQFIEVLIAPAFSPEALAFAQSKPNCRLLQYTPSSTPVNNIMEIKSVNGGILVQTPDIALAQDYQVVTTAKPTPAQMQDLIFSWQVGKFVKSNSIVYVKNQCTLGIGAGQMSRIFSTQIAALKAKEMGFSLEGAVMASDAFFPFKDNVEAAHAYGIQAIIQPGGSKRDDEVIQCANDLGMAMIFTGMRHFRH